MIYIRTHRCSWLATGDLMHGHPVMWCRVCNAVGYDDETWPVDDNPRENNRG